MVNYSIGDDELQNKVCIIDWDNGIIISAYFYGNLSPYTKEEAKSFAKIELEGLKLKRRVKVIE